jgi:hypothetical protein
LALRAFDMRLTLRPGRDTFSGTCRLGWTVAAETTVKADMVRSCRRKNMKSKAPQFLVVSHLLLTLAMLHGVSTFKMEAQDKPKSLLPAFGPTGREFNAKAKDGNKIQGWLPEGWDDNSEWASVSARYSKLEDPPKGETIAVRIKLETIAEGQLQLTSYKGKQVFKKDRKYTISGWIRSADRTGLTLGVRQPGEPYEFFEEKELEAGSDWKAFEMTFSFAVDREALVMFVKKETGSVDISGIVVSERTN